MHDLRRLEALARAGDPQALEALHRDAVRRQRASQVVALARELAARGQRHAFTALARALSVTPPSPERDAIARSILSAHVRAEAPLVLRARPSASPPDAHLRGAPARLPRDASPDALHPVTRPRDWTLQVFSCDDQGVALELAAPVALRVRWSVHDVRLFACAQVEALAEQGAALGVDASAPTQPLRASLTSLRHALASDAPERALAAWREAHNHKLERGLLRALDQAEARAEQAPGSWTLTCDVYRLRRGVGALRAACAIGAPRALDVLADVAAGCAQAWLWSRLLDAPERGYLSVFEAEAGASREALAELTGACLRDFARHDPPR